MYVCVFMWGICVHYVDAHTCVSTTTRRGHLLVWSFFIPLCKVNHWAQRETDGQQAPVILLPPHHYHTYIGLWMQLHMTTSYFVCGFLGFELRTAHLHGKPSYPPKTPVTHWTGSFWFIDQLLSIHIFNKKRGGLIFFSFAVGGSLYSRLMLNFLSSQG